MGFWKALTGKTWKETTSGSNSSTKKKDDKKKSTTLGQVSQTGQYAGDGFEWKQNDNTNALTRVYTGAGKDNNLGTDVKIAGASNKSTKNAIAAISANEGSVFATTKASGTTGIPFVDPAKSFTEEQGISYTPTLTYDFTKTGAENDVIRASQTPSVPAISPEPRPEPPVATPEELVIPEVTVDPITGLTTDQITALANEAIDSAPDYTYSPVTPIGGPGTFAPGALPASPPVGANDKSTAINNVLNDLRVGNIELDETEALTKLLVDKEFLEGKDFTDSDISALMPPTTRDDFTYTPTGGPGTFTPSGIGATEVAAAAQDNNPNVGGAGITGLGSGTTELSSPDFAIPGTDQAAYATSASPGGKDPYDPRTILPTSEQMAELEGTAQEPVDLTPDGINLGDLAKSFAVGVPKNLADQFEGLGAYQSSNPVRGTGNLTLDLAQQILLRTQPEATRNLILSQDPEARREKAVATQFISDKLRSGADALSGFLFPDGRSQAVVTGTTPSDLAIESVEGSGGISGVANVTAEEVGGGALDVLGSLTPQTRAISGALNVGEQISGTQATAEQALNQLVTSGALDDNQVYKDVLKAQGGDVEKAKQALVDAVIYKSAPETASTGVIDAFIPKFGRGFLGVGKDLAVRSNVEGGQEVLEGGIALNALNNVLGLEGENKQQVFRDASGNYVMGTLAGGGTSVVAAPVVAGIRSLQPNAGADPRVTSVPAGMNMSELGALNLGQAPGGGAPNVTILNPSLSPTSGQLAASTVPSSYDSTVGGGTAMESMAAQEIINDLMATTGNVDKKILKNLQASTDLSMEELDQMVANAGVRRVGSETIPVDIPAAPTSNALIDEVTGIGGGSNIQVIPNANGTTTLINTTTGAQAEVDANQDLDNAIAVFDETTTAIDPQTTTLRAEAAAEGLAGLNQGNNQSLSREEQLDLFQNPNQSGIETALVNDQAIDNKMNTDNLVKKFTTSKGSTYDSFGDGTTVRDRAERGDGEVSGVQPRSQQTVFMTKEAANEIGPLFQNTEVPTELVIEGDKARLVLKEDVGPRKAGSDYSKTVTLSTEPEVGLQPVEIMNTSNDNSRNIHFGNEITEVSSVTNQTQGTDTDVAAVVEVADDTTTKPKPKVTITPVTVDDTDTTIPAVTSEITPTTDQTTDVKVLTEVGEFPEPEVEVEVEDEVVDTDTDTGVDVDVDTPMVVPPRTRTNEEGEEIVECPEGYTMVQTSEGPICQKSVTAVRQRAGAGTRAYTGLATRGQSGPGQRRVTITDTERVDPITRSA